MEAVKYLALGDVVRIAKDGRGFVEEDVGKCVIVVGFGTYFEEVGIKVIPYCDELVSLKNYASEWVVDLKSFGEYPEVLTNEEIKILSPNTTNQPEYTTDHYNMYYTLTEKDIEAGKIKVDAYWVAKQWKTGSRDDSGALWHSLKTIARFGEKNSVEREIKALYNQALALARIYNVDLKDE